MAIFYSDGSYYEDRFDETIKSMDIESQLDLIGTNSEASNHDTTAVPYGKVFDYSHQSIKSRQKGREIKEKNNISDPQSPPEMTPEDIELIENIPGRRIS